MKRIPVAILIGMLCFIALAIFSQNRARLIELLGQARPSDGPLIGAHSERVATHHSTHYKRLAAPGLLQSGRDVGD